MALSTSNARLYRFHDTLGFFFGGHSGSYMTQPQAETTARLLAAYAEALKTDHWPPVVNILPDGSTVDDGGNPLSICHGCAKTDPTPNGSGYCAKCEAITPPASEDRPS